MKSFGKALNLIECSKNMTVRRFARKLNKEAERLIRKLMTPSCCLSSIFPKTR